MTNDFSALLGMGGLVLLVLLAAMGPTIAGVYLFLRLNKRARTGVVEG